MIVVVAVMATAAAALVHYYGERAEDATGAARAGADADVARAAEMLSVSHVTCGPGAKIRFLLSNYGDTAVDLSKAGAYGIGGAGGRVTDLSPGFAVSVAGSGTAVTGWAHTLLPGGSVIIDGRGSPYDCAPGGSSLLLITPAGNRLQVD